MSNKFVAILLIVMVCIADASPLLKQWSHSRQQRLKSGADSKNGLQSKTVNIQLQTPRSGGRGRKLSLADPIQTVVNNLVLGSAQANIECKALDKALKAGHAADPAIFYHTDLVDFASAWRDIYNADITADVCIGKLHAIELVGAQANPQIPQVCVGFNKLTGVCPTYTTKFCAEYRTQVDGSNNAAILAEHVIDDDTNEEYEDLYSQRLIQGGGTASVTRKYYATTKPTGGGKIQAGCPGLSLGLEYNTAAADSSDPGLQYVDLSREPNIFEQDLTVYLPNGALNLNYQNVKTFPVVPVEDEDGNVIDYVCPAAPNNFQFYLELSTGGTIISVHSEQEYLSDNITPKYVPLTQIENDGSYGHSHPRAYPICLHRLNGDGPGQSGVTVALTAGALVTTAQGVTSTAGKKAGDILADKDTCPGLGRPRQSSSGPQGDALTPKCSINDFAALITGETVNGEDGSCIRRIYTDLCTSPTDVGHDHQIGGSDVSNGKATYTKPLKISLAAGEYCDGVDDISIGTCALKRKLEDEFVFELSCEALAYHMTASPDATDTDSSVLHDQGAITNQPAVGVVEVIRNVPINWVITDKSETTLLADKLKDDGSGDPLNLEADFHCSGDETSGLCASGKIPLESPCHGLILDGCQNPNYVAEGSDPYYATRLVEDFSTRTGGQSCVPSDEKKVEAWKKAVGLEGTFRGSPASLITDIYNEFACHSLRDDVDIDGGNAIFNICKSLEADLAKVRIDFATDYLLHDAQAKKKDKLINFKKHVDSYKASLTQTCNQNFGTIETMSDSAIKGLHNDYSGNSLQEQLIAAATTPEDVAINAQRKNLDQRIHELEESLALLRAAHDDAVISGVDVAPTIAKFEKIVKTILIRLADAYESSQSFTHTDAQGNQVTVGPDGLAPLDNGAACPHLASELKKLAAEDYEHLSVGSVTSDDKSLPIQLNSGDSVYLTNLVRILEHTLAQVTLTNQGGTDADRTVNLKAGLEDLVVETAEYCLWESQDRYDRCETCAARQQLYEDKNIYRQVSAEITTLNGYKTEKVDLVDASCLEPVMELPGCADAVSDAASECHVRRNGADVNDGICDNPLADEDLHSISNIAETGEACQDICDCGSAANGWVKTGDGSGYAVASLVKIDGGVGNQARREACSIPAQGVLSNLAGISGDASYIKGYPSTGYDDPDTADVVETTHQHPHYASNSGGSTGTPPDQILYDKTTFQNHLAACIDEVSLADTRSCPAQTSGTNAQTELKLSSAQKSNLEAKAVGDTSDFEVKRAHCVSALNIVLADTSLAYDCAVSDPSNTACVDGAITHFVKQCEKTDGSAYTAHASPHSGARDIGVNGPGIFQAVRAYARAEDAYDAAKKAREEKEGLLNIDPQELKNLKDDIHAATTYKNVIEQHIGSLQSELNSFRNRHATVVTKCEALIEAKVKAKIEHAVELKKYDFEVADLDAKKEIVNGATYENAKTALDEYCAQISAVQDAVSIAGLAEVNNIVRAAERCDTAAPTADCCAQRDTRTEAEKAQYLADGSVNPDYVAAYEVVGWDCVDAELSMDEALLCVVGSDGKYNGKATKAECVQAIIDGEHNSGRGVGSGYDGECIHLKANGALCEQNDECDSGICRERNVAGEVDPIKECAAYVFAGSGESCNATVVCAPFGSVRLTTTHSAPTGQAVNAATGRWTQICNAAGKCSDLALGEKSQECATTQDVYGNVGDTCNAGLTCDLASVNARGAEYDTVNNVDTEGKDICIPAPECSDGIQNGLETGIDCGSSACVHNDECVAGTPTGAGIDEECVFHSDCASGAACTQQYVYELSDGTPCDHTAITDGTCLQVASGKVCKDPHCTGDKPVPNILFNEVVQCADSSTATDPYAHTETLNTFTVQGITFKYYVESYSTPAGQRRRLLNNDRVTYDFANYGKKFRSAPMPNQRDRAEWLESVKTKALEASHRLRGSVSSIDTCRQARSDETGSDQSEFRQGTLPAGGEGNSAYSVSKPRIDSLQVCDSDSNLAGFQHTPGVYSDGILDTYGYSVGDNLKLSSGRSAWKRRHARKLRESFHRNKLEAYHQKLMAVTDPTPGFLGPQEDSQRDCNHDDAQFCSFSTAAHASIPGKCSTDCSDCTAGQCTPCPTTTDCEMCGVIAEVPAAKIDPDCEDLYGGSYTSEQACLDSEGSMATDLCVKTHECLYSDPVAADPGYKCDSTCVDGTTARKVDPSCKNPDEAGNDCEDRSAQPTNIEGDVIIGACQVPVDAQTCQDLENCAVGQACTLNKHCDGMLSCQSNVCAAVSQATCSYSAGKSIDAMNGAEIKAAFVSGDTVETVAVNTDAENAAIQDEQSCACDNLRNAITTPLGDDQAVIDQMEARIAELQALIADGTAANTVEGSAHKAIGEAEEALRLYLTNTASGAAEIETLTQAETDADSARISARATALNVASPAYLDYYRDVVSEASFTDGGYSAREDAYALYESLEQGGDLDGFDVEGQDDTYLDELHRIFAACQGASEEKAAMAIANEAAGAALIDAGAASVKNGAGTALDIADCVTKSNAEFVAKKALDDKQQQIDDIEASILSKGYVPAEDIVKKHKHYSCCSSSLEALESLERCAVQSDCSAGGNCIGHFCVPEPCLCSIGTDSPGFNTHIDSRNTDDFPIDDDDCGIPAFDRFCGDGVCDAGHEDKDSCALDCRCGDGECENDYYGQFEDGENCVTCPDDCSSQTTYTHHHHPDHEHDCPPDIHDDGICGCYPDSSGTLVCETLSHTKDCTCDNLCHNYDSSDPFTASIGLTDKTTIGTCDKVSDCTSRDAEAQATQDNVVAFCANIDLRFEAGADVPLGDGTTAFAWGEISKCGEEGCPEMHPSHPYFDVNIVPGGHIPFGSRCGPLAKGFIDNCSFEKVLNTQSGEYEETGDFVVNVDFSANLRKKGGNAFEQDDLSADANGVLSGDEVNEFADNDAGLVATCESIAFLTGINTEAKQDTLKRWSAYRALLPVTNGIVNADGKPVVLPACEVGVTFEDENCQEYEHTLGCPASCSCPVAVQPIFNETAAIPEGTVIKAAVTAITCGQVCKCGTQQLTGMTEDAEGNLYSTSCFNTCPNQATGPVCPDAQSDFDSGVCHQTGSTGTPGYDINDGVCDDPLRPTGADSTIANTIPGANGVCQDICDCGSAANGWTPTGDGQGNPLSRTRHLHWGRKLHDECTGTMDPTTEDEDCSAITQAAMTQGEWEAAVGACFLANSVRVHKFYCEANNGVQAVQTGCTPRDAAPAEVAYFGTVDACYNVTASTTAEPVFYDTPAGGCAEGDAIAKANTAQLSTITNEANLTGHVNPDGSRTRLDGNKICDGGETVASCPTDCFCGDDVCGTDAKGVSEVGVCDVDCVFHCFDESTGGCYNFAVSDFGTDGIGQWNPTNTYNDGTADVAHSNSFASFDAYCGSWAGNNGVSTAARGSCPVAAAPVEDGECPDKASDMAAACHVARGGGDVSDGYCDDVNSPHYDSTNIGCDLPNSDVCDCGRRDASGTWSAPFTRSRKHKVKKGRKLLGFEGLKKWALKATDDVSQFTSDSFKSLIDRVSKRRKLLGFKLKQEHNFDSKPTDRSPNGVPWLVEGSNSFNAQEALCLGSQQNAIDISISAAFTNILGANGLNQANGTVATASEIDDALNADVGTTLSGTPLVLGSAIISLDTQLQKKQSLEGECTASEKATVHEFSKSWVPVEHCYPLKFVDSLPHGTEDVSCVSVAGAELSSVAATPLPSTVEGATSSYRLDVRKGFLETVDKFKYQVFHDDPDVTSECTSKGTLLCSAESAAQRSGGSCLKTTGGTTFPARQKCVEEYRKNLADIALWLDNDITGFTGSPDHYGEDENGDLILDTFKTNHVSIMGTATNNALNKLRALRKQIGDKDDIAVNVVDSNSVGTIQGCWEAYENSVGYALELTWLTASGALNQAVTAVKKEEQAIIQVHADAKAECKEHCVLDSARDDWNVLVARCDNDPSSCKCRRQTEKGDKDSDGNLLNSPVLCNCMFDNEDLSATSETSMQLYNGAGEEDCQVEPVDYISPTATYVGSKALVYAGESPTAIAQQKLTSLIEQRKVEINNFVFGLVNNLGDNMLSDGLLGQQNAGTVKQVCQIMNSASGARANMQLTDDNARDAFFDNYMKTKQNGTVESESAARRLASEPCSLCN